METRDTADRRDNEAITFGEIVRWVAPIRWWLIGGAVLGLCTGWGVSKLVRPVFRAQTTMLPAKSPEGPGGLGGIASQVGGLAALAGININGNDSQVESFEYLKSRFLTQKFIESHNLMPLLFPKLWNPTTHRWNVDDPSSIPTMASALRKVRNRIVRVAQDKVSGLVTVNVEWYDAGTARDWANDYVSMANDGLRTRTIADTQATLAFLTREMEGTSNVQVRDALSKITESQLKTLALAKVREDYAFRILDRAGLPDEDDIVSPITPIYAGLGLLIGAAVLSWIRLKFFAKRAA